ncbi:MAG: hypothetical protein ACRDXC_05230 [Acidimicrobiales bacterium]
MQPRRQRPPRDGSPLRPGPPAGYVDAGSTCVYPIGVTDPANMAVLVEQTGA